MRLNGAVNAPAYDGLARLIREERASWSGGKPADARKPAAVRGKAVSEIVLKDRR